MQVKRGQTFWFYVFNNETLESVQNWKFQGATIKRWSKEYLSDKFFKNSQESTE